jgi:hypothetical protein
MEGGRWRFTRPRNSLVLSSLLIKNLEHVLPHLSRFLAGVEAAPDTGLLIVAHDRLGLLVVGNEALLESIGIVVTSLDKRLASNVILHVLLGGVEGGVV